MVSVSISISIIQQCLSHAIFIVLPIGKSESLSLMCYVVLELGDRCLQFNNIYLIFEAEQNKWEQLNVL